uniref:HTH_48 domain-containing protein n=1 Tax=Steinernema glaseri TaxID=37863 RepID=A0A1I7Z546_9BILA
MLITLSQLMYGSVTGRLTEKERAAIFTCCWVGPRRHEEERTDDQDHHSELHKPPTATYGKIDRRITSQILGTTTSNYNPNHQIDYNNLRQAAHKERQRDPTERKARLTALRKCAVRRNRTRSASSVVFIVPQKDTILNTRLSSQKSSHFAFSYEKLWLNYTGTMAASPSSVPLGFPAPERPPQSGISRGHSGRPPATMDPKLYTCNEERACSTTATLDDYNVSRSTILREMGRLRTGTTIITADVGKAFLQIRLHREDRDAVRFLWVKNRTLPVAVFTTYTQKKATQFYQESKELFKEIAPP